VSGNIHLEKPGLDPCLTSQTEMNFRGVKKLNSRKQRFKGGIRYYPQVPNLKKVHTTFLEKMVVSIMNAVSLFKGEYL
jgi:hypothetical protein